MKDFISNKIIAYIFSLIIIFSLWLIIAKIIDAPIIFPAPKIVGASLVKFCSDFAFWKHIFATMFRCILSFLFTIIFGSVIGIACGFSKFINNLFRIPVEIIRATPVISFILIALFWFTSSQVPVFVSVLMTLPIIISSVTTGFSKQDKNIMAMAYVYKFSCLQKIRWITIPSVIPFFLSGAVSAFGLTWKVVAAGEVLSLPSFGAGSLLQKSQVHLNTSDVTAITIVLVSLSFLLENIFSFFVFNILLKNKKSNDL